MNRRKALAFLVQFCRPFGERMPLVAEAIAALESSPKKSPSSTPSDRGLAFADWFRSTLPSSAHLSASWRESWARVFDALITLDHRTPEDIWAVCRWGRSHSFWGAAFLSPAKLRERKGAVQFFDRLHAGMRNDRGSAEARKSHRAAGEYRVADDQGPRVFDPLKKGGA